MTKKINPKLLDLDREQLEELFINLKELAGSIDSTIENLHEILVNWPTFPDAA